MPITMKTYKVAANIDWEKTEIGEEPRYSWDSPAVEFKATNIVFSAKECADMQSFIAGIVAKHTDQMKNMTITVYDQEVDTRSEGIFKDIKNATTELNNMLKSNSETDTEEIEKQRKRLEDLCTKNPDIARDVVADKTVDLSMSNDD